MWGVQKENEPLPETSTMDVSIELERRQLVYSDLDFYSGGKKGKPRTNDNKMC
jgi:hypothetical protein